MGFTTGLKLHSQAARLLGASDKRSTATPKSVPPLRTFHPLRAAAFQRTSGLDVPNLGRDDRLPNVTFLRTRWGRGFDAWLFPVRSPLLRESRLVTFPPLNDMLKFGGYSRPIPGRRLRSHICRLRDPIASHESLHVHTSPISSRLIRIYSQHIRSIHQRKSFDTMSTFHVSHQASSRTRWLPMHNPCARRLSNSPV